MAQYSSYCLVHAVPLLYSIIVPAFASLAGQGGFLSDSMPVPPPQTALLPTLRALGGEVKDSTITGLEEVLRPTFDALPKNSRGALRPPAARYALHRLFVHKHAWQFRGLEPRGEAWDSGSPAAALGDRVPEDVRNLFESRLNDHGLDLHELAVLAATLESMVHAEADVRLTATFKALNQSLGGEQLNRSEAEDAVDTFMASFLLGLDMDHLDVDSILAKRAEVLDRYPSWPETQAFLRQVQEEVAPSASTLDFSSLSDVVATVGERYGRWQHRDCAALSEDLLQSEEYPNSGRVRLSDFYNLALNHGKWHFSESTDYLRRLGALDDSDPSNLRLIVPNYLLGPSNCLASSGYFAVCCIDECERHLGHIENELRAHEAPVENILKAVNRTVAPALQRRLVDIAENHGGKVPIHGRLFAQWLHHLYPRECPYPHMSGTTNPLGEDQLKALGQSLSAKRDELLQYAGAASRRKKPPAHEEGLCTLWTMEEELVDWEAHEAMKNTQRQDWSPRSLLTGLALSAAVISMVITLCKLLTSSPVSGSLDLPAAKPHADVAGRVFAV